MEFVDLWATCVDFRIERCYDNRNNMSFIYLQMMKDFSNLTTFTRVEITATKILMKIHMVTMKCEGVELDKIKPMIAAPFHPAVKHTWY